MGDFLPPACFNMFVSDEHRMWQTSNILETELPMLAFQIFFTVLVGRLLFNAFRPLHQPRIISFVFVGFLLTPPLLGNIPEVFGFIYPVNGILNVEVASHFGLIYYAFLNGLEMNLDTILKSKKEATSIAAMGIIFPILTGPGLYALHRKFYINNTFKLEQVSSHAYLIWTLVLTVTGFPNLVEILSELKLHYTSLGKVALTAGMISDTYNWILFTLLVPFSIDSSNAIYSVLCTVLFLTVCIFLVRPLLKKIIERKTENDEWDEYQLLFVVMGAFACSYVTDILGTHAIVGAFVYGLILPHGKFADLVMSVSDDFGGGFLAPLYFSGNGMRLIIKSVFSHANWPLTLLVLILLCVTKILGTLFATSLSGKSARDGFAIGLLLNTKGALALIMLSIVWDKMIFFAPTYAVLTAAVLLMTMVVSPMINFMFKPRKRFEQNKLRTIQKLRANAELRILACVHNNHHATSMINILELFNATRLSPIHVFGLYLVEITQRAAALVVAHMEPSTQLGVQSNLTQSQVESENIAFTFKALGNNGDGNGNDAFRVETTSVVSSYETIHQDIYISARERGTSLILLPFHQQLSSDGNLLETTNVVYRDINKNVMQDAPCSVGIFIDRGLVTFSQTCLHILMIFVGGPDDREALAIAWKMAGHPRVQLSMVRLCLLDEAAAAAEEASHHSEEAEGILSNAMDNDKQKELDDEYISKFRYTAVNNEDYISYSEADIRAGEDIPRVLKALDQRGCDLYVVGQGNCRNSILFSNLLEWCDCLELGVIGDILASNIFGTNSSILVVQQYGFGGMKLERKQDHMANNSRFGSLIVKAE
ncbi:cation/H(+) antiporter 15-like [Arachis stenosperma]|uniref:cation/H(+) antiporter 15-like n=1 Tax=Arachis stenosperma TaxID=217475 RepID=UPI0025ACF719|nr:cation/H(+) antiporter 15-like [Arachis stenosperma]